jgi:(p)ppGpp synthase/HD superfamily hydrolase
VRPQSLHTTLQMRLRGKGYPFEVQIRTHAMHQVAEFGLASHFSYKGDSGLAHVMGKGVSGAQVEAPKSRGDFLTWLSKVLAQSEVYVWGPDGRLLNLSRGSTLLDVIRMYAVTKKVSKRVLRQWKLNGRRALLCRELESGDVITGV